MRHPSLADERLRHPLLTEAGRDLMRWMQEHPRAPRWNYACGDQLTAEGLARVEAFGRRPAARWGSDELPPWVMDFAGRCLREVPFFRAWDAAEVDSLDRFRLLPTCSRPDLLRVPWAFVEDTCDLSGMMVYDTSGTTASKLAVMADAEVSASYLPLLRRALSLRGVEMLGGGGRVSILLVGAQASTLTYATVSSVLGGAGFVKLNLSPGEWRTADDCVAFIDALQAEVVSGDPLALEALAALPVTCRPRALVSTAMTLLPGMQASLEARFGCPVLDLYSLTECRLLGVGGADGHLLVRPDVYVEVLDEEGRVLPSGSRGELTISGGNNPFLRLLRYRTGDFGALQSKPDGVYVVGLEGRMPVVFVAADGRRINNIDITHALRDLPLSRFALHQAADASFTLRCTGAVDAATVVTTLRGVLGMDAVIRVGPDAPVGSKLIQYTSGLA